MSWLNVLLLKGGICSLMAEALGIGLLFWHATVLLPHPGRGAGTLIPSAQRLGWAAKQPLGNAALGALFA